jgi:uncharacterized tellurite resistance protein B-like protein
MTATAILLGEITSLERRAGVELGWFRQQLPAVITETLLKQRMRMLRALQSMRLWTESAFAEAQMRGDFLSAMREEAKGTVAVPSIPSSTASVPQGSIRLPMERAEEAVLDAVLAMAGADGRVVDVEVAAILETLRRMFGRASTKAVEAVVRSRPVPSAMPYGLLETALTSGQRQLLLLQLAEVAAADRIVAPEERRLLESFGERLGVPTPFIDAVLGSHLARADTQIASSSPLAALACPACAFEASPEAAFCSSCGARLR